MKSRLLGMVCTCVFTLSITSTARADATVPADLLPGDTYQLAFVTSLLTTADSGDINTYNSFVQGVADSAGIGVSQDITWKVIGSTSAFDARDNAFISAPVYNMIGERVADGFSDMWDGSLANPINYTEYGNQFTRTVWTGTTQDGAAARLNGSTVYLGSPSVAHGNSDRFNSAWIYDASFQLNITQNSLYALSSPITVLSIPPAIDIKPSKDPNIINLKSGGFVRVAVLTGGEFDALQVDPVTTKFGPNEAMAARYQVKDVDEDGDADLLLRFRIQQTGIACSDTEATLTGELYDGTPFTGTDSIETKNCTTP